MSRPKQNSINELYVSHSRLKDRVKELSYENAALRKQMLKERELADKVIAGQCLTITEALPALARANKVAHLYGEYYSMLDPDFEDELTRRKCLDDLVRAYYRWKGEEE